MTGGGPYKAGDELTITEAAKIYAERDRRKNDHDESAQDRARKLIEYAIDKRRLLTTGEGGKSLRRDSFAYWAGDNKPRGKGIEWVGDFAAIPWNERFNGLYEVSAPVVRNFSFECDYQYQRDDILKASIPTPTVEASREWVEALQFAKLQNDALRARIAELEEQRGKRAAAGAKGGRAKRGM